MDRRLLVLISLIWGASLWSSTYNNPGSGGVNDGYLRKNERAVSGYIGEGASAYSGQAGANLDSLFFTWDDNYIYIFLTTNNTASWDVAYGFGIDVISNTTGYTGGTAPSDAWKRKIGFDNGYNVEYEIYFFWSSSSNSITSSQLCSWDGSAWSYTDLTEGTDFAYSGDATGLHTMEIKIARASIGNPTEIALSAWVAGDSGSSAVDAIPDEADVADGDWTDDDFISTMYSNDISVTRTPNYFLILDGELMREGYQTDEVFYTTSDKQFYITWDQDSLYIGYIFEDFSGVMDFCVYFDTDPQKNKHFGKGIDIDSTANILLPFNADYGVYVKDGLSGDIQWLTFDGSDWVASAFNGGSYIGWSGNGTTELSIPWTDLGSPDSLYVVAYSYNTSDNLAYGIAPNAGNTDGNYEITNFIGIFKIENGFSPSEHIGDTNHIMEIYSGNESGNGTLRDAIVIANSDTSRDTVIFRVDADIVLQSNLPKIVYPIMISGGNSSVTIDGNSKTYDGFTISTDSLFQEINFAQIDNILIQNAISAIRISVGNGAPMDTVELNNIYVQSCINGFYTGLAGETGTNGGAYDNINLWVSEAYMSNIDDYGIYLRTTQSGKKVRAVIADSYIETAGDADNEAGVAALDNVSMRIDGSELRGNYWGLLLWNTTSAEAQYDTVLNSKIDSSFYHGTLIKREAGDLTLIVQGDSIFSNGSFGTDDAGVVISAFSDGVASANVQILSSKIFDDASYQEYGVLVTDWVAIGDSGSEIKIGDANLGNEIEFNNTYGIWVNTDRAKKTQILYNYIHDNGTHGIYITQADSLLIQGDTIKNHSGTNQYGILIDGGVKSYSDYNKITQSIFENNSYGIKLLNGANGGIATVQIASATINTVTDVLTVEGNYAPPDGTVEVYIADSYNGSVYLNSGTAAADGSWTVDVNSASSYGITDGTPITAIGISPEGNTSEFAAPVGAVTVEEEPLFSDRFEAKLLSTCDAIHLQINIPQSSRFSLRVFDASGRLVARKDLLEPGNHEITLPMKTSGVYFVEIAAENRVIWKNKTVVIKKK